jgi:hypothetical protein
MPHYLLFLGSTISIGKSSEGRVWGGYFGSSWANRYSYYYGYPGAYLFRYAVDCLQLNVFVFCNFLIESTFLVDSERGNDSTSSLFVSFHSIGCVCLYGRIHMGYLYYANQQNVSNENDPIFTEVDGNPASGPQLGWALMSISITKNVTLIGCSTTASTMCHTMDPLLAVDMIGILTQATETAIQAHTPTPFIL